MPLITDYYGKASKDTEHSVSTTVITERTSGVTVLACFDLSTYAEDTPIYFVTYTKTTDPLTSAVTITDTISWKGLVNAGENTITNLEIAPGYVDTGNTEGQFVECIPTSYWANQLIKGISTHSNQDGTLITQAVRDALALGTSSTIGWEVGALPNVSTVTANGNRSYTIGFASTVASILSDGMRVRTTRTVASRNTSFLLDGTNDYYVKTSPSGMTFTDDFSVSAWVYLTEYKASPMVIASRFNNTSGWSWRLRSDGRVDLIAFNASNANYSEVISYQSVPLNKWVHISAQLDMSAFTATTTTSYVMIDGKDVPATVARGGTNPTALIQAGNLEIGSDNGGTSPFAGYITEVAIYSDKVTQATHLARMHQGIVGNEANLISAYGNGSVNDLSATGNDLTATNGATTIQKAPFGNNGVSTTLDYGLIMNVSTTDVVVQVPEGCTIPTSGGVASVDYSTVANPYGFPKDFANGYSYDTFRAKVVVDAEGKSTVYGWGFALGNGTSQVSTTGYFPITFSSTPYMVGQIMGYKNSSDPTSMVDVNTDSAEVGRVRPTSGSAYAVQIIHKDAGTLSSSARLVWSYVAREG